jgi:hypothetical protein
MFTFFVGKKLALRKFSSLKFPSHGGVPVPKAFGTAGWPLAQHQQISKAQIHQAHQITQAKPQIHLLFRMPP